MDGARERLFIALRPFLEGDGPNEKDEWALHCPLPTHSDAKRSASINFRKGKWYCHACCTGGSTDELVELMEQTSEDPGEELIASFVDFTPADVKPRKRRVDPLPTEGAIKGWHASLRSEKRALRYLTKERGLEMATLASYEIGWNKDLSVYTIPVRDDNGILVNVRFYDPDPTDQRRKIWGVTGHNVPTLFPVDQLVGDDVVICEGEWDALLAIQHGFHAVTRTGSAKVWRSSWNLRFGGKRVFVCHDMDTAGQLANNRVTTELKDVARETRTVALPYPVQPKDGQDLTDYFHEDGHTAEDFSLLLKKAKVSPSRRNGQSDLSDINVLESFDAASAGRTLRMRVTITGKKNPTFLVPEEVSFRCAVDAGAKCAICPLQELRGELDQKIDPSDPSILEMIGSSSKTVEDVLRTTIGAQKCGRLSIEPVKLRSVEELYARPSVEHARIQSGDAGDYTNRKIISVGRHDTLPNNTVEVVGSIHPSPKSQHNEFQAWEVHKTETSIDRFEVTPAIRKELEIFKPDPGVRPLKQLGIIARDLAAHVTKIYGRPEMHAAMDLAFHSALQFEFGGVLQQRGWLEVLVVGDTRTGKSDVAVKMIQHYQAGELVSCESATFAGIVGGLQQFGSGKEWEITWGAIPLNDRRLVALDEISGLTHDQIAQMSSIRSSGEAQLTKIRSERTFARTRLIWLGNPRNGRLSDYTYGVQAILPLIGNNEDVARFDLAMSVAATEVPASEINRQHRLASGQQFPSEPCQLLLQWAWSRRLEHILWDPGVQEAIYDAAIDLGQRYVEQPPLIQAANVRIKIARLAVALAIRTFSTDLSGELVIVQREHVEDVVKFVDLLYGMPGFGYREHSAEILSDLREAVRHFDDAKEYLYSRKGLAKFLRSMGRFRIQDLQDMLSLDRDEASAIVNKLWELRMIIRQGPEIRLQPILHELLREIK